MTISDPNFPVQHHTSSIYELSKSKLRNNQSDCAASKQFRLKSEEKFSLSNLVANMRLHMIRMFSGPTSEGKCPSEEDNKKDKDHIHNDYNNNNNNSEEKQFANVEETIRPVTFEPVGQHQAKSYLDPTDKRSSQQTSQDEHRHADQFSWCKCVLEATSRAARCDLQEFHQLGLLGKVLMIVKVGL